MFKVFSFLIQPCITAVAGTARVLRITKITITVIATLHQLSHQLFTHTRLLLTARQSLGNYGIHMCCETNRFEYKNINLLCKTRKFQNINSICQI